VRRRSLLLLSFSLWITSCGDDLGSGADSATDAAPPSDASDAGADSAADAEPPRDPPPPLPTDLADFERELALASGAFRVEDGEWLEDYGDAPFYALAFFARAGEEEDDGGYRMRAAETRAHNLAVVADGIADTEYYLANLEEVLMAGLGLLEQIDATGDRSDLDMIDALVDATNGLLRLFGNYLPNGADVGSFALETYGPTTLTAAVALLNLQYAKYLPDTDEAESRIATARTIVEAIDRRAFDGTRYMFEPERDRLYLYPNVMMMLVSTRLFEITGERAYLARAEAIAAAIAPLEDPERGGYRSPYSAEAQGAQTDDYSTLSSQNYLSLALILLFEHTGDRTYFDEAVSVLDFIRTKLYSREDGRLLHHWMDGRIAQPEDPSYFCSGCNFQFLYVMWHLRRVTDPVP
jgi:hypothetical protein